MFPHFTRETSGHNPLPKKAERFKNRVGHKFVYARDDGDPGAPAAAGASALSR